MHVYSMTRKIEVKFINLYYSEKFWLKNKSNRNKLFAIKCHIRYLIFTQYRTKTCTGLLKFPHLLIKTEQNTNIQGIIRIDLMQIFAITNFIWLPYTGNKKSFIYKNNSIQAYLLFSSSTPLPLYCYRLKNIDSTLRTVLSRKIMCIHFQSRPRQEI